MEDLAVEAHWPEPPGTHPKSKLGLSDLLQQRSTHSEGMIGHLRQKKWEGALIEKSGVCACQGGVLGSVSRFSLGVGSIGYC